MVGTVYVNKSRPQGGVLLATRKPLEEFLTGPEAGGHCGRVGTLQSVRTLQRDRWPQSGTQEAVSPLTGKYGFLSLWCSSEGGFLLAEYSTLERNDEMRCRIQIRDTEILGFRYGWSLEII
ncbi:hypothetical protein KIL84_022643 [Mauremys mutica]|uniref:Uncharacterized protein n=1 Tax=Mauremys mutica TaxID=74926 RepID=A0A9D3WLQ0_9SAUR|nr:hypothetical protein KIL84_022643 [Mauremys mutica]